MATKRPYSNSEKTSGRVDDYAHQLRDREAGDRAKDNARFQAERVATEKAILAHSDAAGSPRARQARIAQDVYHGDNDKAVGHSPDSAPDDTFDSSQTGPRWHSHSHSR